MTAADGDAGQPYTAADGNEKGGQEWPLTRTGGSHRWLLTETRRAAKNGR